MEPTNDLSSFHMDMKGDWQGNHRPASGNTQSIYFSSAYDLTAEDNCPWCGVKILQTETPQSSKYITFADK